MKASNKLSRRQGYIPVLGVGHKSLKIGIGGISTCVLGLLCKDGVWMGKTEAGLEGS